MLIAGTLREYPFPLLLEIFLRRRETGLLEVSSTQESGYFYFKNGKIKDGQIGDSKGLAAVKLVGKFTDGSFRLRPLEPTDYARVVWQRSFGPTGLSIGESARSAPLIANALGQFRFVTAAVYRISRYAGSFVQRTLRQFLLDVPVAWHRIQEIGLFLIERTVTYASAALAFWKRAQVGTKVLAILKKAARPDTPRRNPRPKFKYQRELSFQAPLPRIPSRVAIGSALKEGVEHNVIFALTVIVLLVVSGVSLYQLVLRNQHSIDAAISVDKHSDTAAEKPANTTRPRVKPKRSGSKRGQQKSR